MDIRFMIAVIGLLGVLTSAIVQLYLGRKSEINKKIIEVRAQAYLDLLNSVSVIAGSSKHNNDRNLEQLQKLTQAKTRVVLIGSDEVIRTVNNFWVEHGSLNSKEACSAFSLIVLAMRKDLSGKNNVPSNILFEALFGKFPV